ncbi:hypothetical protein, partial [Deinococcus sp.]|uniref:hypothetical protein n=1 Tax=Deinococcus sp. TaxID=47478 RepID=UPI0025C1557E
QFGQGVSLMVHLTQSTPGSHPAEQLPAVNQSESGSGERCVMAGQSGCALGGGMLAGVEEREPLR